MNSVAATATAQRVPWLAGAAALDLGLFAGLFGTFSVAVMPRLRSATDVTFVEAMQTINAAILNPAFLVGFGAWR